MSTSDPQGNFLLVVIGAIVIAWSALCVAVGAWVF